MCLLREFCFLFATVSLSLTLHARKFVSCTHHTQSANLAQIKRWILRTLWTHCVSKFCKRLTLNQNAEFTNNFWYTKTDFEPKCWILRTLWTHCVSTFYKRLILNQNAEFTNTLNALCLNILQKTDFEPKRWIYEHFERTVSQHFAKDWL